MRRTASLLILIPTAILGFFFPGTVRQIAMQAESVVIPFGWIVLVMFITRWFRDRVFMRLKVAYKIWYMILSLIVGGLFVLWTMILCDSTRESAMIKWIPIIMLPFWIYHILFLIIHDPGQSSGKDNHAIKEKKRKPNNRGP